MRALLLSLFAVAVPLSAQQIISPPPGAVAFTFCLGGRVETWVNAAIIGTDSLDEIMAHEAVHQAQYRQSVDSSGACLVITTVAQLLNMEIPAYCASNRVRMQRTHDFAEAQKTTLLRLFAQFRHSLPEWTITHAWEAGCRD